MFASGPAKHSYNQNSRSQTHLHLRNQHQYQYHQFLLHFDQCRLCHILALVHDQWAIDLQLNSKRAHVSKRELSGTNLDGMDGHLVVRIIIYKEPYISIHLPNYSIGPNFP